MSFDRIQKTISSLANRVDDSEKIATHLLVAKLEKYAKTYPYDQTIGSIYRIMDETSNKRMFVTRAEFKDLYRKLYSRNTKFASLFENELGQLPETLPNIKIYDRDDSKELPNYQVEDQVLSNALNTAFDNTIALKTYSQELANKSLQLVKNSLDAWNLKPINLNVVNGNEKFLVVKADYDTPKGITSFYIPIELHGKKISEASLFIGNSGPQDLLHTNIKKYLTTYAGSKLQVAGDLILNLITKAASGNREITDTELALTKLNASRQQQSLSSTDQIVGLEIEKEAKQVNLPKSKEYESFEKSFSTPQGYASLTFGEGAVKTAKDLLNRTLSGFGYKNYQLAITGSDKNSIFYGVSLDNGKVAFTVPLKIFSGKLKSPNVLICNGSVSLFNKENINKLYIKNETDFKVAAATSPQFDLKPSDLINNIRDAIENNNHAKAEDALNVLAHSGDNKAYAIGFNIYFQGLSNKKAEVKNTCSRIIKLSSSQHSICSHTNLPIHKIYVDDHGNCRPLYRRGMDESYEAASFINYKVFG